ncbi:gliding-associated putative ABC transporter substrate-binding component GldG [Ancylomarina subtilis]|uniref:Gliding-associated putative ABC transporter substrate-binding component GldG n=1 Tax=Ancylomarina subtilis TaxID=1639035 RepID=A0A4Q7VM35_9BACT|nr:GldG family protein [Ancylomarina subtilis]RZT97148.1 gliding-associated putative ABC transporter substrate-binding component GldG [Ancylomarina subtilis]
MRFKDNVVARLIFVLSCLIILNILSSYVFFRVDFTADKRYTLDKVTKRILREVKDPIIITMYVSEDLPPDISRTIRDFKHLLTEYNAHSKKRIEIEEVNPNSNEELEMKAIEVGIHPVPLEVREKDQVKVQKVFLGLVIQVGEKSETIPLIQPGIAMEYNLSTLIKRLTIQDKPKVGYVIGHGEPVLATLDQMTKELSVLYDLKTIDLNTRMDLSEYKAIMILSPFEEIKPREFRRLDNYLATGGGIFVGIDRVNGILNHGIGVGVNTNLETWLEEKGILVEDAFIVDKKCSTVTVQEKSYFSYPQQYNFPYLPLITEFSDHSITDGIEAMILQFASPLKYVGDSSLVYHELAWTSDMSGKLKAPVSFNIGQIWGPSDFLYPRQTVAAALHGPIVSEQEARLCVIGDGNFIVNGVGEQKITIQADNINFVANAIDWLSDDSGLMSLRTKGVQSRPLKELTDSKVLFIKYFNFLFPLLLVVILGLLQFRRRSKKRTRLMKNGVVK